MISFQISLTEKAGKFIQEEVSAGRYPSPDRLINELVEQASDMANDEKLAELIREGLECEGEDIEFTDEWWEECMDKVKAEVERRRSA
jgi:Arc/MetJ-type ribon-helix-helix transcriptional regulator